MVYIEFGLAELSWQLRGIGGELAVLETIVRESGTACLDVGDHVRGSDLAFFPGIPRRALVA